MKFAVGYQQPESDATFSDMVRDYKDNISEVYFPWVGTASGRNALGAKRGSRNWDSQNQLEYDLENIRESGIKLDLLFNANCYGQYAVSEKLENEVLSILEHLEDIVGGTDIVTTTSPAIARTVKKYFPKVEVRASVNMRIGNVNAMKYVSGLFDSFYIQRDFQRDIEYVKKVKKWCDENRKGLYMLANSGCLYTCPGQIFHDNTVAHDAEIDEVKNIQNWTPHVCWNHYQAKKHWPGILQATWIRPEDMHNYAGIIQTVKLATRLHSHPQMVIGAYVNRTFAGNLLNLFEPSFASIFAPWYIDNKKFPPDFFEQISRCGRECEKCGYCEKILAEVLVKGRM